jgi:inhibitor of cysteine peptidase
MHTGKRLAALLTLSAAACLGLAVLSGESAAALGDKKEEKKGNTVTVTVKAKDKEGKAKLARGDMLEVRLPSNRTTGFGWQLAKYDKDKLKSQGKPEYEKPKKPLPGAGGVEVFRFTAEAAGKTELELVYKRPFEKDKPPARTYKLTVEIE